MLLTIIIFILVLSVLVFVHEFGHFWTARRFGIKAEEFGFGFPPRAIGWYRNVAGVWRKVSGDRSRESLETAADAALHPDPNATIYSLNWLPIGGFVKIKGENGEERNDADSFAAKAIWQRTIILAAGVIMNVVLAWFLFSLGYLIGLPQVTGTYDPGAHVTQSQVIVAQVIPHSAAEAAGLKSGDIIKQVGSTPITTEGGLQDAIAADAGHSTILLVDRGGTDETITVTPPVVPGGRATIGIAIFSTGLVSYPFFLSIWEGAKTTVSTLGQIFAAFYGLIAAVFHGQNVSNDFAGPVGIASITGQAVRLGFTYLLQFMALLSLNLAVLNILPFPALDGGRILFLLIEKAKGKPVRRELETLIHNIGFLLLIALVLFVTYQDIVRLF